VPFEERGPGVEVPFEEKRPVYKEYNSECRIHNYFLGYFYLYHILISLE
jgi:hypothetical protein